MDLAAEPGIISDALRATTQDADLIKNVEQIRIKNSPDTTADFISALVAYEKYATWWDADFKARKSLQISRIKSLIQDGTDVNACNHNGTPALNLALLAWKSSLTWDSANISSGALEIVHEILLRGANPNVQDEDGFTPLHIAVVEAHSDSVRIEGVDKSLIHQLVKAGAYLDPPPHPRVSWPTTPLILAVGTERVDTVKLLISLGAKVNTAIGDKTALKSELHNGGELFPNRVAAIVTTLLEHGVDLKSDEKKVLSLAISHVPESVERFLSECYGEPNASEELVYIRKETPEIASPIPAPVLLPSIAKGNNQIHHGRSVERLCCSCCAFEKNAVSREWYRHSEDSDALYQSVASGCGMCQLIKDCLPDKFGVVSLYYYSALAEADTLSRDYFERIIVRGQVMTETLHHGELHFAENHHFGELRLAAVDDDTANILSRVSGLEDRRTGSQSAMELASHWMKTCRERHGSACHLFDDSIPLLPTRVIDVGSRNGSEEPHLLISNGQRGHYSTLSYCWGDKANLSTTTETLESYVTSIPFEQIPRTIQEAVLTTRRLGIRYLWVDTLCILQDSLEDWLREAKNIASVYRNSLLTIAAADSVDSEGGLFRQKQRARTRPVKFAPHLVPLEMGNLDTIYIFGDRQESNDGFRRESRLDERGWVLQEQLLSPRTLNFSSQELYWDCPALSASESYPAGIPKDHDHNFERRYFTELKTKILGPQVLERAHADDRARIHMLWQRMVVLYSKRNLSRQTDKLVALAGAANQVSIALDDKLAAGLWVKWLWRDLLWWVDLPKEIEAPLASDPNEVEMSKLQRKTVKTRPAPRSSRRTAERSDATRREFQAPSWSWASVQAPISYDFPLGTSYLRYYPCLQILNHNEIILPDAKGVSGSITVRGLLLPARLHPDSNEWAAPLWQPSTEKARRVWPSIWHKSGDVDLAEALVVWKPDDEDVFVGDDIQCLVVAASHQFIMGMGLAATEEGKDEYKRVGLVYWSSLAYPVPAEVDFGVLTIV